jgi:glycosyltransferase involved in cell wall biosynthesis
MKISVAIVGHYPPPYGGVPVHIMRLFNRLSSTQCDLKLYCQFSPDINNCNILPSRGPLIKGRYFQSWLHTFFFEYGFRCTQKIIHCHDGWAMSINMLFMLLRNKKIIFTFHDQMTTEKWRNSKWITRLAAAMLFRSNKVYWIAVSKIVKDQIIKIGVPVHRIAVIPAYISPDISELKTNLPEAIKSFISTHNPILTTYGWRLYCNSNGIEIHRFDMCLNVVAKLKKNFPNIGLVILLPQIILDDHYATLLDHCRNLEINNNVLFYTEPLECAIPIWKAADVYVRATMTDGDALSIRESLSMGTPVIASDASIRPDNTVVFKTGDQDSFYQTINQLLNNLEYYQNKINSNSVKDNYEKIMLLYQMIMDT